MKCHPSGGTADQSHGQRDQVAGGGPWDAWKSAQPAPHRHRGDGRPRGRASFLLLSPGLPLPCPVLGPILPQQEEGERLSVQAASAEAHQEVTVQGGEEGKRALHEDRTCGIKSNNIDIVTIMIFISVCLFVFLFSTECNDCALCTKLSEQCRLKFGFL